MEHFAYGGHGYVSSTSGLRSCKNRLPGFNATVNSLAALDKSKWTYRRILWTSPSGLNETC